MRRLRRILTGAAKSQSSPSFVETCRTYSGSPPRDSPSTADNRPVRTDFSEADVRMLENVAEIALRVASSTSATMQHSTSAQESPKTTSSTAPIPIPLSASASCRTMNCTPPTPLSAAVSWMSTPPSDSGLQRSQSDTTGSRRSTFGASFGEPQFPVCLSRLAGFSSTDRMHGYDVASSGEQRAALDDYRCRMKRMTIMGYPDTTRMTLDGAEV